MPYINRTGQNHRTPIAIAKSASDIRELIDIATLSLGGLAITLLLIAQHAGSGVLKQMFAL